MLNKVDNAKALTTKSTFKIIYKVSVPLIGSRGGRINLSMNNKGYGKMEPWMIKKRIQTHFKKYVERADPYRAVNPYERRYVKFVRVLGKGGRLMDQDNFKGGCKPIMDLLQWYNWLFDDDIAHVVPQYKQAVDRREDGPALEISIGVETGRLTDMEF